MTLRIAGLASGRGSNIQAIWNAIKIGQLDAQLCGILSNVPEAPVVPFAQENNIFCWSKSHKGIPRQEYDALLLEQIKQLDVDVLVLAGYMRIVSPVLLDAFPQKILNIHPALLPSFPGVSGIYDAMAYGVRFTGATVHFVDVGMDSGPIIIQGVCPLKEDDTIESAVKRIQYIEHRIYVQALQWLAQDRLRIDGRRVLLSESKKREETKVVMEKEAFFYPPLEV